MKTPDKEELKEAPTMEAPPVHDQVPAAPIGGVPLDENGTPILEQIDSDNNNAPPPDEPDPMTCREMHKEEAEAQQKLHEMLKKTEAGGVGAKDGAIALDGPTPHGETKKATDAPGMRLPPPQLIDEKNEKMFSELEKEPYFHGSLPLEDVQGLLQNKGDFLVRTMEPEQDKPCGACLTIRWDTMLEFPIYRLNSGKETHFTVDGNLSKPSVVELIKMHMDGVPIGDDVRPLKGIEQQAWQFSKDRVEKQKKLGEGQFGEVWKGRLEYNKRKVDVAIKVTKVANKECLQEFFRESRLMRQLRHVNIVNFYGIIIQNDSVTIIMELMEDGGLDSYLKKNHVPIDLKCSFVFDAAFGLYYLHNKGILHRDIAARNCLVHMAKNIVKISDFGLSKQAESYKLQPKEVVPIRWQAPEVLRTKVYTRECDIYSYGLLMWEVFNDGVVPFAGTPNAEIRLKVHDPKYRPKITENIQKAPPEIATMMTCTWSANAATRPQMKEVCKILFKFCKHVLPNVPGVAGKQDQQSNKTKKTNRKESNMQSVKAVSMKSRKEPAANEEMSRKPSKKRTGTPGTKSVTDASCQAISTKKKKKAKK